MAERPELPDDNPFRANSPRNVLARAKERIRLVRHWLIRQDGGERKDTQPVSNDRDPDKP